MDGNKDEALRCMRIAEEAIANGNKQRALKFIGISRRLNPNLPFAALLDACEKIGCPKARLDEGLDDTTGNTNSSERNRGSFNGEKNYTEEHIQLIREVRRNQDYYAILGVGKTCSVEEIRKAYKKLSLKVHPDKNKAPGSEEAFKKVSKAFKCLSDDNSRRQYDQMGLVEEYEHNVHHTVRRRRRRRTGHEFYEEDFDPDEIFRAFFGQGDLFRNSRAYRTTRGTGMPSHRRAESDSSGFNFMVILQIIPFLIIILLAYLPFSEPEYSFVQSSSYKFSKTTEIHGVEFFVKSATFDGRYPPGSDSRASFEDNVVNDYKRMLWRHCHVEMQRRHWNKKLHTPNCDKLHNLGVAY